MNLGREDAYRWPNDPAQEMPSQDHLCRRDHDPSPHFSFFFYSNLLGYRRSMSDDADTLIPAEPRDLADAIAFAAV